MTLNEALEAINRGETTEQFRKRIAKLRRLANERDFLLDAIEVLGDDPRADKKQKRLACVEQQIKQLVK